MASELNSKILSISPAETVSSTEKYQRLMQLEACVGERDAKKIHDFIETHSAKWISNQDTFLRHADDACPRTLRVVYDASSQKTHVYVWINRKQKGDTQLGKGAQSVITCALDYYSGLKNAKIATPIGGKDDSDSTDPSYNGIPLSLLFDMVTPSIEETMEVLEAVKGKPGIVKVIDICRYPDKKKPNKEKLAITQEWMQESFPAFISRDPSIEDKHIVALDLLQGLTSLHESGYAHRDLSAVNMMVNTDPEIRGAIIDLGSSMKINEKRKRLDIQTMGGNLLKLYARNSVLPDGLFKLLIDMRDNRIDSAQKVFTEFSKIVKTHLQEISLDECLKPGSN